MRTVRLLLAVMQVNKQKDVLALASAVLAAARGRTDEAVRELREGVRRQDELRYMEPPAWYYPVRQSLGAVLLSAGRAKAAETVYREDLGRNPENGWSLYGLARSLRALAEEHRGGMRRGALPPGVETSAAGWARPVPVGMIGRASIGSGATCANAATEIEDAAHQRRPTARSAPPGRPSRKTPLGGPRFHGAIGCGNSKRERRRHPSTSGVDVHRKADGRGGGYPARPAVPDPVRGNCNRARNRYPQCK